MGRQRGEARVRPAVRAAAALVATALCACTPQPPPPPPGAVKGVVVDRGGAPVPEARVRYQGTEVVAATSARGAFVLPPPPPGVKAVTAWRDGLLNGGARLEAGVTSYRIVLAPIPAGDDPGYRWASPRVRVPARAGCDGCHPEIVGEWSRSAHATSARNPLFLAAYAGVDQAGRPTGGPSYRRDLPGAGNCTTCHVPVLALVAPFGADPATASGVAAEGISCDPCHKIADAAVDRTGGRPGVLSYRFARPPPGEDVFFGQLEDVVAGPDTARPLYRDSRYCAPCHHGTFWSVRVYPEFEEWAASSYAARGVHCQDCHMPPAPGRRRIAPEGEGGVVRDAATLSSHLQLGLNDPQFMRSSVKLAAAAERRGEALRVRVSVTNATAGHHVPTGSPMRQVLLVVDARDSAGRALPLVSGERLPAWTGEGSAPADLAGRPGRAFAKVLAELVEYPADRAQGRRFVRYDPAPYWRPTILVSDTRIPADGSDVSEYAFALPPGGLVGATVKVTLVYRRTFRSWGTLHRVKDDDLVLASATITADGRPLPSGGGP
jgi:hypothetical protein